MVVFIDGMVTVSRAERQTMLASRSLTASANFSGATSTPRSITSKPPPSSMEATRFLPMSCRSPFTVPITTRPTGSAPRGGQQRPDQLQGALHGPGGQQQFGHEVLVALEAPAHLVHGRHHVARYQFHRIDLFGESRLSGRDRSLQVAVENRFVQHPEFRHVSPIVSKAAPAGFAGIRVMMKDVL